MKRSEDSRGNSLRRMALVLRDLISGKEHDRRTVAEKLKVKPAAADRHLRIIANTIPGVVSEVVENRRRIFRFDASAMNRAKQPTKQTIVAACFGASLGNLFDGSYKVALREALDHLAKTKNRGTQFADVDRKFWFVRRGGEGSLPAKEVLLHEFIDGLLERNIIEIEYESFHGTVAKERIVPLSVIIHDHQIYFVGRNDADEIRSYRLSRMIDVERQDETFDYPSRMEYDPEQIWRDSFGIFTGDKFPIENVRIRLSPQWRAFARSHRWHSSQQIPTSTKTAEPEGDVEVHFRVRVCPELENWILGFGGDAEVLAPESLRARIIQRLRSAAAVYDDAKIGA